jgi:hypothetical protein
MTSAAEFFTAEQEDARERAYRLCLVERYQAGLPLPAADRREARKLIREAKAFAKQAAVTAADAAGGRLAPGWTADVRTRRDGARL